MDGDEFLAERRSHPVMSSAEPLHCYRMLGSLEDAEDLVQETFLRAWRKRASFGSDCCQAEVAAAGDPAAPPSPPLDLPWLQPYPDRLLESIASVDDDPGCGGRCEGDDRACLPRRHSASAAEIAGGVDPPGSARMVGAGDCRAARRDPRFGERRAPEGPSDASGAPTEAPDGVGAALRAELVLPERFPAFGLRPTL
jgi:hypothetical protein